MCTIYSIARFPCNGPFQGEQWDLIREQHLPTAVVTAVWVEERQMGRPTFRALVPGAHGRCDRIARPYSPEDGLRLRGSLSIKYTLAERTANKCWQLLHSEPFVPSL